MFHYNLPVDNNLVDGSQEILLARASMDSVQVQNMIDKLHYTTVTHEVGLSAGFLETELAEFDGDIEIAEFEAAVEALGIEPIRLDYDGDGRSLLNSINMHAPRLLWNMNSGLWGKTREAQVPVLCEFLKIPFTGSGSWTAFLTQDKYLSYLYVERYLNEDLVVPPYALLDTSGSLKGNFFSGPYIVKPNNEGSSRGIGPNNPFANFDDAFKEAYHLLPKWGNMLIQQYVEGVDVSANLTCDIAGRLIPVEPLVVETGTPFFTMEAKTTAYQSIKYTLLRDLVENELANRVMSMASWLGRVFEFRHYARFDLRVNLETSTVYFIESNLCPSFDSEDDFATACRYSHIEQQDILHNTIRAALE